jgi:hypothetical protein
VIGMTAPDQRFVPSADVVSRVIDGEAVLLDLASGKYLGLNEVATRAWVMIGEGKAFGAFRAGLVDEFDVEADVLERDLDQLFAEMLARELIRAT